MTSDDFWGQFDILLSAFEYVSMIVMFLPLPNYITLFGMYIQITKNKRMEFNQKKKKKNNHYEPLQIYIYCKTTLVWCVCVTVLTPCTPYIGGNTQIGS